MSKGVVLRGRPAQRGRSETFVYSAVIFLYFFLLFLLKLPEKRDDVIFGGMVYYLLDYALLGFNSRLFIGSVISLFCENPTYTGLYVFCAVFTVLMLLLVSLCLGKLLAGCTAENRRSVFVFTALFMASPFSVSYLLQFCHMGRLELFLLIFSILALVCIGRKKLEWLIPVLCLMSMATFHNYIFLYMPMVCVPLLYKLIESKFSKRYIALCVTTYSVIILSFLYFQFLKNSLPFTYMPFSSADEMCDYIAARTDVPFERLIVYLEYFGSIQSAREGTLMLLRCLVPRYALVLLGVNLPYIVLFSAVWLKAIRAAEKKIKKLFFFVCMVVPLASIPAFVFATDWDRWASPVLICQFAIVFWLLRQKDSTAVNTVQSIGGFLDRHTFLLFAMLAFTLAIELSSVPTSLYFDMTEAVEDYHNFLSDFVRIY